LFTRRVSTYVSSITNDAFRLIKSPEGMETMSVLIIIWILLTIAMAILLVVEARKYTQMRAAAEAMMKAYQEVTQVVNNNAGILTQQTESIGTTAKSVAELAIIVGLHSTALALLSPGLQTYSEAFLPKD
jgi:hypothetical protein